MNKRTRKLISILMLVVLMSVTATAIVAAASPLMIDSFSNSAKWSANKLNDLNKSVSWSMDSIYYGSATPGEIVMNSGGSGQYYQETIAQSISGGVNLTLRMRDWWDSDTENHWNVVLNDGTDHAVALNTYGNIGASYIDINIPLSAFNANLANVQYVRLVHKDGTYAVLLIDAISIDGGVGPTSTPGSTATNTPVVPTATRTNTSVAPTNTSAQTLTRTNTPGTTTPTKTPTHLDPTRTNTPVGPTNTSTQTLTRTNTVVAATNTPTRTNTSVPATATVVAVSYEAESSSNTLAGGAVKASCGACSGGQKVGYVGNNSGTLQFNGVNATSGGTVPLAIYYTSGEARAAQLSVNGGAGTTINFASTGGWDTVGSIQANISLNAGGNTIKFSNSSGWAPDFDRIVVNPGSQPSATQTPLPTYTSTAAAQTNTLTRTPTSENPTLTQTPTPVGPTATPTITRTPGPTSSVTSAPAGPPPRPDAGPAPDTSLTAHALVFGPSPIDNPLKGFLPYYVSNSDFEHSILPHSLQWNYFALNEIYTNWDTYNWAPVEQMLDEVAFAGRQSIFRFYMEYPSKASAIPQFLISSGVAIRTNSKFGNPTPDYDDPRTIHALTDFIKAFGARYDGDPRIGFITMGLVGLWGEWHTWPNDVDLSDGYPNYFPTNASVNAYIDAYAQAFHKTPLEIRYASLGGGTHLTSLATIGYHDDSWCYRENRDAVDPATGQSHTEMHSMTLPQSMNGWTDAFLQLELSSTAENKWITASIGGEVRPDIQSTLFTGANGDNWRDCVELTHATWMLNQAGVRGNYSPTDPTVQTGIRLMGYELSVKNAYFKNTVSAGALKVGVQIENRSVASFQYGPEVWPVMVGLKDSNGNVVQSWQTDWDLRKVMPLQIRKFPDWNVGSGYQAFGYPYYFDTTVDASGVGSGSFTVVMRVRNPLENWTEADWRARGHVLPSQPYYPPKMLRFANTTQGADGWLTLGSVTVP